MANNKKKVVEEGEVVQSKAVSQPSRPADKWGSRFMWATFFIVVGVIMLLVNLGLLSVELSSLWRLWPILIIVAGLSVLSLRGWVGGLVYGVAALGIACLTWAVLVGPLSQSTVDTAREDFSVARAGDDIERAKVSVKGGAASIDIKSQSSGDIVNGSIRSSFAKIKKDSSVSDRVQDVKLSLDGNARWWQGGNVNNLAVNLTNKLPVELDIDTGAVSVEADLSDVMLESLDLDAGASSVNVKLGDKVDLARVDIDTGASSIKLQLPESVGVELVVKDGLSSKDVPRDYKEIGERTYRSANYDKASKRVVITVDMGVSSLEITNY
ncbi:hypothetical protein B7Y94_00805 [Candidatus Saccharibacteria bacterium 32-49-12]|nr:MAG: hypothetical protein B7Y94_00805 [Candidatus Saccharibacteria bacterium 32-49-12]